MITKGIMRTKGCIDEQNKRRCYFITREVNMGYIPTKFEIKQVGAIKTFDYFYNECF